MNVIDICCYYSPNSSSVIVVILSSFTGILSCLLCTMGCFLPYLVSLLEISRMTHHLAIESSLKILYIYVRLGDVVVSIRPPWAYRVAPGCYDYFVRYVSFFVVWAPGDVFYLKKIVTVVRTIIINFNVKFPNSPLQQRIKSDTFWSQIKRYQTNPHI